MCGWEVDAGRWQAKSRAPKCSGQQASDQLRGPATIKFGEHCTSHPRSSLSNNSSAAKTGIFDERED